LTDDEAKVSALNQYLGGGMICFTEPMAEIDLDRLGLLRHVSPALGKAAVPRDMFEAKRYPAFFDAEIDGSARGLGVWHTLSMINWEDHPQEAALILDERLLGDFVNHYESFAAADFWSGRIWRGLKKGAVLELEPLAGHACHHIKIIPEHPEQPLVLFADGHFSMGGTECKKLVTDGKRVTLQVGWAWDYPLRIILAAPLGRTWASNQPSGVRLMEEGKLVEWTTAGKTDKNLVFELGN
jgi:hypothetical protein